MKGKNKCKILKEIRQRIADENDIPYVTRECTYRGDCTGTCPRCEAELRYLEQELEKRRSLGKTVAVAAVAAGLSLSLTGCVDRDKGYAGSGLRGEIVSTGIGSTVQPRETREVVDGEIDTMPPDELGGEPLPDDGTQEETWEELEGDVAVLPESEHP